ncbi:hypothetical protein KC721_01225, partial [Candidatus Woesebacteria bacterium]|nr:hypothetical protein [Candidatus Woesebacteria bacterium]
LFIDELSKHEEFSASLVRKKEILEEFGFKPTDTMHFTNGSNVSAQHCTVLEDTDGEIKLNLELTQYAGDIFDLLLSIYDDNEKKELLALITRARTDFSLLPAVSQVIDKKWGKGTYSSFLRNTFSFDSLNTLKTTLENKKYCITLLEKFRKKVELADDLETKKRVLDEIKKELQEMDSTRYAIAKSKYYREVREMPEQRSDLFTNDDDNLVLQLTKIAQDLQNSIEGELPKYITISRSTEPIGETKLQKLEVGRPNKVQLNFMVTDAVWPYDSEKKLYFMIQSFQDTQTRIISTANSNKDDQDNIPSITFSALQKWDAITIDVTPTEPNTPIEIGYMLVNENGMPVLQGTLDMHTA